MSDSAGKHSMNPETFIRIPWRVFDEVYLQVRAMGLGEKMFFWPPGADRGEGGDFPWIYGVVMQRIQPTKDELLCFGPPVDQMQNDRVTPWFSTLTTEQNKQVQEAVLAAAARWNQQSAPPQPQPSPQPTPGGKADVTEPPGRPDKRASWRMLKAAIAALVRAYGVCPHPRWKFHFDAAPPVVVCKWCGEVHPMPYGEHRQPYL